MHIEVHDRISEIQMVSIMQHKYWWHADELDTLNCEQVWLYLSVNTCVCVCVLALWKHSLSVHSKPCLAQCMFGGTPSFCSDILINLKHRQKNCSKWDTKLGRSLSYHVCPANCYIIRLHMALGMAVSVRDPLRMNPSGYGDLLMFRLAPPWAEHSCFSVKCFDSYCTEWQ